MEARVLDGSTKFVATIVPVSGKAFLKYFLDIHHDTVKLKKILFGRNNGMELPLLNRDFPILFRLASCW